MIHFIFTEKEPRYLFLKCNTPDDEKWLAKSKDSKKQPSLTNRLNLVDPICNLKSYEGPKFTQDFLFEYCQSNGQRVWWCSIGLWDQIRRFFEENFIEYDGLDKRFLKRSISHTYEEFVEIVNSWGLSKKPREYQLKSAYKILEWKRSVSEIATRAGKTLIAYIVFRYCIEHLKMKKILAIVPSISLVKQMYDDFKEYNEFFKTECIWSAGKLVESANFTVGTFQSLIKFLEKGSNKYNPHFFDGYDCVFVDETHRASAMQVKTIITQPFMKDVIISFGMTGTLPKDNTIEGLCIRSLLGAKIQQITTSELKDAGYISDIEIWQYRLHYKNIEKQVKLFIKCMEYTLSNYVEEEDPMTKRKKKLELPKGQQEFLVKNIKHMPYGMQISKNEIMSDSECSEFIKTAKWIDLLKTMSSESTSSNSLLVERMMVHFMQERISFLVDEILPMCDKNTLILCHHTEYINYLAQVIEEKYGNEKTIVKITGNVSPKKREEIKMKLVEKNNCILVASYGCMSTGITLSDLCYGVLFESFKSGVVNMQSIGRGLGLSDVKDKYRLFDITDCFWPKLTNKIYLQGLERTKIYRSDFNKHKYHVVDKWLGDEDVQYEQSLSLSIDKVREEGRDAKRREKKKKQEIEIGSIFDDI